MEQAADMTSAIRVSRVLYPVTALGPGRRLGIWTQGCPLACAGCLARDTWDPHAGRDVRIAELAEMFAAAVADGADGLTISGGEPLTQAVDLTDLLTAADAIRRRGTRQVDFLVYTGYDMSEIEAEQSTALRLADAVIYGRYDVTQPTELIWRGSANQRLVPNTPLGQVRYLSYLDHAPERPPMQVSVDERDVWLVGVPRRGDLRSWELSLRDKGVSWRSTSWRP